MDNDKITINGKYWYVIPECKKEGYTLCVAAEPWGMSTWGDGTNGQRILSMVDNSNLVSLTYAWYESLPEGVKKAMLTVRVTTSDYSEVGEGVLKQTEMFVPSYEEWTKVPQEVRKMVASIKGLWSRSYYGTVYDSTYAWCINANGVIYYDCCQCNSFAVAPAFYLEDNLLESLLSEKKVSPRKMSL